MPLLELPHWLMIVGAVLVLVGFFGLVFSRRNKAELEPELLPGDLDSWKAQQPRLSDRGRSAA